MLKHFLTPQFIRFVIVGVFNTLFGYAVFVVALYSGLHYAVASAVSIGLGALFNFQTIGRLVFQSHEYRRLAKFLAAYGVIYILKVTGLFLFLKIGVNSYLGGALLLVPLALVSFTLHKTWVFRKVSDTPIL